MSERAPGAKRTFWAEYAVVAFLHHGCTNQCEDAGGRGVRTLESRPAHAVLMFAMPLLCSLAAMTNIPTLGHWAGVACGLWHCLHAVCMQTMGL